jgi:hypothetical protein
MAPVDEDLPLISEEKDAKTDLFALSAGYGLIKGEDFYQLNHIDLSLGGYLGEKKRLEGFIGYGYALIDKTSGRIRQRCVRSAIYA